MQLKSWCSPGQLVVVMLAGWINRQQQAVIAYQKEEIKVLREMLGGKRLRFTDEQRRRLALKAQALSRCTLKELGPLVTPDTLCRWFRKYAGAKYDSSGLPPPGRPPKPQHIRDLVVRLAKENTSWGYTKLRDVMFTLGHKIGRTTVRRILAEDGIEPAPERRKHMPWATFLKAHWGAIAAMDFFKVEVMRLISPVRYTVLVVMDLKTRHVEVAGIVREAYEEWMVQVLRNLTDVIDGFLLGKTHVIMDRDPVFTAGVRGMLRHAGAKPVRLPRRSPNLNAFIEGHRTIAARSASTRTKEAAMIKNSRMYVGVDLHKSVIQVCVLGSDGTIFSESRHRGSSLKEGLEVVQHLTRWKRVAEVCVESVGMNRWFVNASIEAGLEVIVVDPVKLNLRMLGKKTDRRDAYEIARRLRLGDIARNAQTYYPTEEEYGFRKLLRTRHKLVQLRQQLSNQIRGLVAAYRLPCPTTALYLPKNLKILSTIQFPNQMLRECHESIVTTLQQIQASIDNLTKSLERRTRRSKAEALIEHVPSVGFQTAATLFYELGDVRRFKSARAAASYAGLVPRVAASADKSHHGKITKRGNTELRLILSQMAVRLMSRDPRVQAWAGPRLRRMHKNKVRMTLARRLLVGVYYMLRDGEVFDLNLCLGVRTT